MEEIRATNKQGVTYRIYNCGCATIDIYEIEYAKVYGDSTIWFPHTEPNKMYTNYLDALNVFHSLINQ